MRVTCAPFYIFICVPYGCINVDRPHGSKLRSESLKRENFDLLTVKLKQGFEFTSPDFGEYE